MTSGQKIAFSLLAALGLFAGFVLSLNTTLFKELETRFYTQAKIEENTGQLDKISESCDSYISEILTLIEKGENAWTKNASVRSYYVQNPSESDVNTRRRLTETLFSQISALNGIRIVDKNGRNVHYSSFDESDLLKQNGISKIYKNYNDIVKDTGEIDFETLQKITSETKSVLLCDESRARLILSVPFCWVDGIYSGVCLFYLNMREVEKELIARDAISLGEGMTLFADDDYNGGFILNLPYGNRATFREPTLNYWKSRSEAMARGSDNYQQPEKLLELPDGRFYVALSSNRIGKIRISAVYTSDIFELSAELRLLIYICIFISILLIVFLIFSFFRDPVVTLQKRIKKLQLGIIENYLDGKEKREWNDVARQLRTRRNDLSEEIIKSLHVHSKKRRKELSEYLEKNWDEIFAIFEAKAGSESGSGNATTPAANAGGSADISGASIAEIRRMLEEVLQNRGVTTVVAGAAGVAAGASVASKVVAKKAAPIDEVDDVDDVEELDEIEELAEDVDQLDEVEELTEDVDELDEVEEIEDADEVEELSEDIEDAEELEEVEELAEDVGEAEDVEEVEELTEDVEELDEVEELTEPVEEAEEVDEIEELPEDVEDLEEAEELAEESEDLDEVENLEPLEELEELDELPPAVPVMDDDERKIRAIIPPKKEYSPSNDTYFASENFADVDNLFAELLHLGSEFDIHNITKLKSLEFTIYPVDPLPEITSVEAEEVPETTDSIESAEPVASTDTTDTEEPVEELTEEVPEYIEKPDFAMTSFGDNLSDDIPELDSVLAIPKGPDDAIVENDGVFSISENLEYTNVIQDPDFKNLVDSIL